MQRKDYYGILGIAKDAKQDEVKKAYRKLAFQYHPDTNEGDPAAEDKFKEIGEAYDVLGDKEKRNLYDRGRGHDFMSHRSPFNNYPFGSYTEFFAQNFGMFGCRGGGFGGGFGRGRRFGRFIRPEFSASNIILSSEEAQSGTEMEINLHTGNNILTFTINLPPGIQDGALLRLDGTQEGYPDLNFFIKIKVVD